MTHLHTIVLTVGVATGIMIGELSVYGSEILVVSLFIFISHVLLLCIILWKEKINPKEEKKYHHVVRVICIVSFFIFVGIVRTQFSTNTSRLLCETSCTLTGRVSTQPEIKDMYQVFDITPIVSTNEQLMRVRVRTPLYPEYEVGDMLVLSGKITAPKTIYPHTTTNSSTQIFDYDAYLMTKNIGSEMYYPKVVEVVKNENISFKESLMILRQKLVERIKIYVSSPASSLASGMLLGDKEMSKELTQTFRVAGLSHIVVLSGFNIAILIAALLTCLRLLPVTLKVIASATAVTLFVLMVGAEASIVRAALMASIALLALLVGRGYVAHQALLISFVCIIMYSPQSLLYDVSLHLSFLATVGIVYLQNVFKDIKERLQGGGVGEIITTTLSAYIMTLPYVMYVFGTASLYGIIANLLVLPFVPLIMFLTFIIVFISFISTTLSYIPGILVSILADGIIWVARLVEHLPYASLSVTISPAVVICMYIGVIMLYVFLRTKKKDETQLTNHNEILSGVVSY